MKISKLLIIFFLITSLIKAKEKYVKAELFSYTNSIQPGILFWVGVKLSHKPEWHTYWRNPGDSGLPTKIEWELPEGFANGEIEWPSPSLYIVDGIANFGYEKETTLLISITPPKNLKPGTKIFLKAKVSWLACRVECVPESENLTFSLPVINKKAEVDKNFKRQFNNAIQKLPLKENPFPISAALNNNSAIITVKNPKIKDSGNNDIRFFPYEPGYFDNLSPQKFNKTANGFTLQIMLDNFKIGVPKKLYGVLYNKSGWSNKDNTALEVEIKFKN